MNITVPMIASPCTGICKLDAATGWCLGCARSGTEMDGWQSKPEAERAAIWAEIPARLAQLGVGVRRLPWTTEEIRVFVAETLARGAGTWTIGVVGAVAEFAAAPGEAVEVDVTGDVVTARTANAALRVTINDDVRALTCDPASTPAVAQRVLLAVKRERGRLPLAPGLRDLGPDPAPLLRGDAGALVDLGLARKEARFCVRLGAGAAHAALALCAGKPLSEALPQIGPALLAESPTRVVESALGRIEVRGRIPPPDARSPAGAHTQLLPAHLATGRALPVGMDLPRAYLPGAIFYPSALHTT